MKYIMIDENRINKLKDVIKNVNKDKLNLYSKNIYDVNCLDLDNLFKIKNDNYTFESNKIKFLNYLNKNYLMMVILLGFNQDKEYNEKVMDLVSILENIFITIDDLKLIRIKNCKQTYLVLLKKEK